MNISILLMEQIIQLFLMIFMGYLIVKVRLVKDEDSKVLSKIILYLIIPCVIINAFQVDYTMDTVKGLLLALAASVMTQVLLLIIISIAGMLFAGMNLKQIFADKRVYFVSFLRLIAVPLLALVMIKISHLAMFSADGNKIMLIVFLAIITPSASTITQMCQVYGNDSRYASAINVMTTLFSIITMPLMVMLFEAVI